MSGPTEPENSGVINREGVISRPTGAGTESNSVEETMAKPESNEPISDRTHHGHSEQSQFQPFTSLSDQKRAGEREYGYDQGHPVPTQRYNEDYSFMGRKPGKKSYFSEFMEK
ncbi:hypothetical protein FQN49_007852 [Arthroderma sp. PD_2]|nr:hypothetical protein FQN49_007852 [Arthroderma sp. PD_2]